MALATVSSFALDGLHTTCVAAEVHLSNGLPSFTLVGLPDAEVRESRDRVRAAIVNSGFEFPRVRLTVNLAPADIPKESGRFDLPIALGILAASHQIPVRSLSRLACAGELSLSGELRPIRGALAMVLSLPDPSRWDHLVLPAASAAEASLGLYNTPILCAPTLADVCAHLKGERLLSPLSASIPPAGIQAYPDLADVRGQHRARRALEIAASGGHGLLMSGPPGSGKSMLAARLPGLLPALNLEEARESAAILSLAGLFQPTSFGVRPCRCPHHTASSVALVGGGNPPRPGEISLAHCGILFLDELPEFSRRVLESLREPLETGQIHIARATRQATFPARFQLVAAMNPCPCGWLGVDDRCRCTPEQIRRYQIRISGPLLDRIDLQTPVPPVPLEALRQSQVGESTATVRQRVETAHQRQRQRQGKLNAQLDSRETELFCPLEADAKRLLIRLSEDMGLSARGFHRLLRVARTIADLAEDKNIAAAHLAEASQLRRGVLAANSELT